MASLSEQLHEVRRQAELCLYSGGTVVEVRAGVTAMANVPLPPCSKYCHIAAESMVKGNSFGSNRKETLASLQRLSTALNILEKYGCNLTNHNRPKYWRTVKHNNPVFRATVDAIQGGRAVLCLYGYSNQLPDGLSFPDNVTEPDVVHVARVTLEVMSLRMELDMLVKEAHPHPEFYERIIPTLRHKDVCLNTDAVVYTAAASSSSSSSSSSFSSSSSSGLQEAGSKSLASLPLHPHSSWESGQERLPSLAQPSPRSMQAFCPGHTATANVSTSTHQGTSSSFSSAAAASTRLPENCTICGIFPVTAHCPTCVQWLCTECDRLYHSYPERGNHHRSAVTSSSKMRRIHSSSWRCLHCIKVNSIRDVLCEMCERPRLALSSTATDDSQSTTITGLYKCSYFDMIFIQFDLDAIAQDTIYITMYIMI